MKRSENQQPQGADLEGTESLPLRFDERWNDEFSLNEFGETVTLGAPGQERRDLSTEAAPPDVPVAEVPDKIDRFEVREALGRGGFGAVYRAFDPDLKRDVAIKVPLLSHTRRDEEATRDLFQEAQRVAQLNHPGIVTVFDVGVHEGLCYIVSDLLDGPNLNHLVEKQPLAWPEAVRIVAEVADALDEAHRRRTVHRDIKPGNIIMVQAAGQLRPVIVDFGLAISDEVSTDNRLGTVSGTPNYMAPEQVRGEGHLIDGRTDIYALGVVLYRLLCGQLPFRSGKVTDLLRKVLQATPPAPSQVNRGLPPALDDVCLRAMAKRKEDRFDTAAGMAEALREILRQHAEESAIKGPQRRQVTVLHCVADLLVEEGEEEEALDAEEQHELLARYQQVCRDTIARLEGTIVELSHERMLACFGYPVAWEDSPRRAVAAGLRLLEQFQELRGGLRTDVPFEFRLAVHTDSAVLEEEKKGHGLAVTMTGSARNVVVRLVDQLPPDAVIVTGGTQRLVQGFWKCSTLGSRRVRGVAGPIELFEVEGDGSPGTPLESTNHLTPLVGRAAELAQLRENWDLAQTGEGQILCIRGEAGLGKSRLLRELREHIGRQAEAAEYAIFEWRASPLFRNTQLYAASDFFESLLHFERKEAGERKFGKLVDHLRELELDDAETAALFASLLSLPLPADHPPLQVSPVRQKEKLLEAMLRWIRAAARKKTVLFVVEDLHWADPTTLEFLDQLVELDQGECRLLALLTFRPEFTWDNRERLPQIALSRLTAAQTQEMMERQLGIGSIPRQVIDQMIERTEGVPLFIEEFSRVLQESGALRQVEGHAEIREDFDLSGIPSTLQDLLISRLDRLCSVQDVMQQGAILGREFGYDMIRAVTGLDDITMRQELEKLVEAELLFQHGRPPHATYTFKHALIQDAAYNSLVKKSRLAYHKNVAEVLEQEFPDVAESEPERLAHHFTEAGEFARAIPCWLRAGQRFQARSAHAEAAAHLQSGLQLIEQLAPSARRDAQELEFRMAQIVSLIATKGYAAPEVSQVQIRARLLCEQLGEGSPLFYVLMVIWENRFILEEMDGCLEVARQMLELAEANPAPGLLTEAHWSMACTSHYRGEFRRSLEHAREGWSHYDKPASIQHAAFTAQNSGPLIQSYIAMPLWHLGYPDQAWARLEEAVRLAEELEHPFTTATIEWQIGFLAQHCRLGERAEQSGEREIALCREQGFPFWLGLGTCCVGVGKLYQGKPHEALEPLREGIEMARSTGARILLPNYYGCLAEACWKSGDPRQGLEHVDVALQFAIESNERFSEAELHRLRGEILNALGDDEAEACLRTSLHVAQRQEAKSLELRTAISLARFWKDGTNREQGRQLLSDVLNWFTEGFEMPTLQEARRLLEELSE